MASATALDVINRAGRRLTILAGEEAWGAAEAVDALQTMNDMMFGFGPMGIYYVHVELAASDTVNVPDEQVRNVMLMLCNELADDYGVPISQKLADAIQGAKLALQAAYWVAKPGIIDPVLNDNWWGYYSIARDQ